MPAHLRFSILGGRSFGKTSLATSLMNIAGNTNGTIIVKGSTQAMLAIKNDELDNHGQVSSTSWNEIQKIRFSIRTAKGDSWLVSFKDYPGEYFGKYEEQGQSSALRETPVQNQRTMDSAAGSKAKKLQSSLKRTDALIILLPWDIDSDDYRKELPVYTQKILDFIERNSSAFNGMPICLAINKWDLNPNVDSSVDALLSDDSRPFGKFFKSLKQLVGDHLFCMSVSAFGKHRTDASEKKDDPSEKKDDPSKKKAKDGVPLNVFEMMVELARRTDQRKLASLKSEWNTGSFFRKTFVTPFVAFRYMTNGCSGRGQRKRFLVFLTKGFKRVCVLVVGLALVLGAGTALCFGWAAGKRLSDIRDKAASFMLPKLEDRDDIADLQTEYETVSLHWRQSLGRETERSLEAAKERFNATVSNEWCNALLHSDLRDGQWGTMHPTNRFARSEARETETKIFKSRLFEAIHKDVVLAEMQNSLSKERSLQQELKEHQEFDAQCYERLAGIDDPGQLAKAMYDLLDDFKDNSTVRPDEVDRLKSKLNQNQEDARTELLQALSDWQSRLSGNGLEDVLGRCTNMVACIDAMESRFIPTNFACFAETRNLLLEEAFSAATNTLASPQPETAIAKTRWHKDQIAVCDRVAGVWDAADPRSMFFSGRKDKSKSEIEKLRIYVDWENDFETNVTATTAEEGRARQLATFLDKHKRYDYPNYTNKWDILNIEKTNLVAHLLTDLDSYCATNPIVYSSGNLDECEKAATNRLKRIEVARTLLPAACEEGLNIRKSFALNELATASERSLVEDNIQNVESTPLENRLKAIEDFCKSFPSHKDRMVELQRKTLEDIENLFADRLVQDPPSSTNFIDNAEYYMNRASVLRKKADYFPPGLTRSNLLTNAKSCESERQKFGAWENIQKQILAIEKEYTPDHPEMTITSLVAFDRSHTNSWTTADAIAPWFARRDTIQKKTENRANSLRQERLQDYGDLPQEDEERIKWHTDRIQVFETFKGMYYPNRQKAQENEVLLNEERTRLENVNKRVEFRNAYTELQRQLTRNQTNLDTCLSLIRTFKNNYPQKTYAPLSSDILTLYKSLDEKEEALSDSEAWNSLKRLAEEKLKQRPTNSSEKDSLRNELSNLRKRIEPFLSRDSIQIDAKNTDNSLALRIKELNEELGAGSYAEVQNRRKQYQSEPTPDHFSAFNRAINQYDFEKATAAEANDIRNWKEELQNDFRLFSELKRARDRYYHERGPASFERFQYEYIGLSRGEIMHSKFSFGDPGKLEFWNEIQTLMTNVGNICNIHCREARVVLKGAKKHDLEISGPWDYKINGATTIPRTIQVNRDFEINATITIRHNPSGGGNERTFSVRIDRHKIFGGGLETGKVLFPDPAHPLRYGSTIQFEFDGLPQVIIPEYKFEEKR